MGTKHAHLASSLSRHPRWTSSAWQYAFVYRLLSEIVLTLPLPVHGVELYGQGPRMLTGSTSNPRTCTSSVTRTTIRAG